MMKQSTRLKKHEGKWMMVKNSILEPEKYLKEFLKDRKIKLRKDFRKSKDRKIEK